MGQAQLYKDAELLVDFLQDTPAWAWATVGANAHQVAAFLSGRGVYGKVGGTHKVQRYVDLCSYLEGYLDCTIKAEDKIRSGEGT